MEDRWWPGFRRPHKGCLFAKYQLLIVLFFSASQPLTVNFHQLLQMMAMLAYSSSYTAAAGFGAFQNPVYASLKRHLIKGEKIIYNFFPRQVDSHTEKFPISP